MSIEGGIDEFDNKFDRLWRFFTNRLDPDFDVLLDTVRQSKIGSKERESFDQIFLTEELPTKVSIGTKITGQVTLLHSENRVKWYLSQVYDDISSVNSQVLISGLGKILNGKFEYSLLVEDIKNRLEQLRNGTDQDISLARKLENSVVELQVIGQHGSRFLLCSRLKDLESGLKEYAAEGVDKCYLHTRTSSEFLRHYCMRDIPLVWRYLRGEKLRNEINNP